MTSYGQKRGQKVEKKMFFAFFHELSHSDSKNAIKKIWSEISPLWGHVIWDLEFFWKNSKFSIFFFVYFFELTNSNSKKTKIFFLSIMRSGHLRLRIFLILFKNFDFFFVSFFEISFLLIRIESFTVSINKLKIISDSEVEQVLSSTLHLVR